MCPLSPPPSSNVTCNKLPRFSSQTMDLEYSSDSWLAFSLAQHSERCLLQPFSAADPQDEEASAATELVALAGMGPKLEDFLGGPLGARYPGAEAAAQPPYDPELRSTIAAGYLRGSGLTAGVVPQEEPQATSDKAAPPPEDPRKAADSFGQRTSIYRGVTRHRWTGRYEAHLWDNSCRREGQSRKGRQVYLGGYDKEEKAARAYDLAALKYWGPSTTTNFPISNYEREMEEMNSMTRQEFVASLRRKSSGFSRGASMYRGVTRHHQHGRWQARIGRVAGNKDLYLGTFSTQEEAAEAYDIAAIKFRGLNAVTNFDMSRYDVDSIVNSDLPVGGAALSAVGSRNTPPSRAPPSPPPPPLDALVSIDFKNHDYWSLLPLHGGGRHRQQSFGLFSPGAAAAADYDGVDRDQSGGLVWSNGVLMLEQQQPQQIPFAAPIGFGGGNNFEASDYMGSWIAPVPPPPSSSSSIYGMEL